MANGKVLLIIIFLIVTVLKAFSADAADFYGATVTDQEVTTVAWRSGIVGIRPTVGDVAIDSPAEKQGFNRGDIILSVNNTDVGRSVELSQFTTNTLSVQVFDGKELKTLSIDRLAIEKEKAARIAAELKAVAPKPKTYEDALPDYSPPVVFNETTRDIKPEKTVPARSDKADTKITGKRNTKTAYEMSDSYGGKTLKEWSYDFRVIAKDVSIAYQKILSKQREQLNTRNPAKKEEIEQSISETKVEYNAAVARIKEHRKACQKAEVPDHFLTYNCYEYDPLVNNVGGMGWTPGDP